MSDDLISVTQYISTERRALRLLCPGDRWCARPLQPMTPASLLVDGAPPGAYLRVCIYGEPMLQASGDGLPASLFTFERFEKTSRCLDWATLDTTTGISIEIRDSAHRLITEGLEVVVFGGYLRR